MMPTLTLKQKARLLRLIEHADELVAIAALLHIEADLGELLPGAGDREPAPGG